MEGGRWGGGEGVDGGRWGGEGVGRLERGRREGRRGWGGRELTLCVRLFSFLPSRVGRDSKLAVARHAMSLLP